MDKSFEHKIASKFENFENPTNASNWAQISKGLDEPFETKLKNKLSALPVVVSSGSWAAIESSLPGSLENQLQDKFNNFDAPVNASVWAALSQKVESMPGIFEESIKDKFEFFENAPPASAMQGVFSKLDKTTSINWRKTTASIAAVFLVFSTLMFLPKNTEKFKSFSSNPSSSLAFFGNDETPDAGNLATVPKNGSANKGSGESLIPQGLKDNYLNNSSKSLSHNNSGSRNNNFSGGNNNKTFSGNNLSSNKTQYAAFDINKESAAAIISLPSIDLNKLSRGESGYVLPSIASIGITNSFKLEKPNGKIDFGISTSNGSFAMKTNPNSAVALYDEGFSDFQASLYQTGMYNTVGADLTMAVSKKAKLLSGLNITSARNAMAFDIYPKVKPSSYNSLIDNGTVITNYYNPQSNRLSSKKDESLAEFEIVNQAEIAGDSVTTGNEFKMSNKYLFFDIPIGFQFELAQRGKTSISARVGSKIRLIAGANSYHLTSNKKNIIEVSPAMSQAFYQSSAVGFAGVSLNKEINNEFEFFVGPEVNINLTDINKLGTWMSMRPFQVGVNVGLRHKVS